MPEAPAIGEYAFDFNLPSTRGPIQLSALLKDGAVLLVFYPQDRTLVCTRQLCNYRDNLSAFEEFDVQIVGVNANSLDSHIAFSKKYDYPFPLVSDEDRRVCHAYGALLDLFQLRRHLVLVGEDGRVWWRHSEYRIWFRKAAELHEIIEELRGDR